MWTLFQQSIKQINLNKSAFDGLDQQFDLTLSEASWIYIFQTGWHHKPISVSPNQEHFDNVEAKHREATEIITNGQVDLRKANQKYHWSSRDTATTNNTAVFNQRANILVWLIVDKQVNTVRYQAKSLPIFLVAFI